MNHIPEDIDDATVDRFLFEARRGFEAGAPADEGDVVRIERMAQMVLQRRSGRVRPAASRRRLGAAAGIALLLGAGLATAAFLVARRSGPPAPAGSGGPPAVRAHTTSAAPTVAGGPRKVEVASAGDRVHPPVRPGRPAVRSRLALAPETPAAVPAAPVEPTALELFVAGNRARTAGDGTGAIQAYELLQRRFALSSEATASQISLGMLYLERGRPGPALEQFRAFRHAGSGSTMSEAYWGEAQALRQIGDLDQEIRVLEELLRRFPDSAYAGAAGARLSVLRARL